MLQFMITLNIKYNLLLYIEYREYTVLTIFVVVDIIIKTYYIEVCFI